MCHFVGICALERHLQTYGVGNSTRGALEKDGLDWTVVKRGRPSLLGNGDQFWWHPVSGFYAFFDLHMLTDDKLQFRLG